MNIHIWRYNENQRNFPGYHLSADAEGCEALGKWLLHANARPPLSLQPVTSAVLRVPNNRGGAAKYVSYSTFNLRVRSKLSGNGFVFSEGADGLTLECSPDHVQLIVKGVEDIRQGKGDYSIGGDQHVVWFWWYPKNR